MTSRRANPFEPVLAGEPLLLTFDSRSLSRLSGQADADARYLLSLSNTPNVDGLVAWALPGFAPSVPACHAAPTAGRSDDLTVRLVGEPVGFIGGVPMSDQWARIAADKGLTASATEALVHYGQVTTFHHTADRHLFVTADRWLLRARQDGPMARTWVKHGVVSVNQALFLVGALTRMHGRSYEHVDGGYRESLNNYTLFFRLAVASMPNRLRFAKRWLEVHAEHPSEEQIQRLQQSLFDRAMDLFRSRDYAQRESLRNQQGPRLSTRSCTTCAQRSVRLRQLVTPSRRSARLLSKCARLERLR